MPNLGVHRSTGRESLALKQADTMRVYNVLRLTIACNGELDDTFSGLRPLTLVPVDAGC
jgi:hypothetical protein